MIGLPDLPEMPCRTIPSSHDFLRGWDDCTRASALASLSSVTEIFHQELSTGLRADVSESYILGWSWSLWHKHALIFWHEHDKIHPPR